MNNNLVTNIRQLLQYGAQQLAACSSTARLDSEVLLTHILQVDRTFLIVHAEQSVDAEQIERFTQLVQRRLLGEPIAYLLGRKEFWSLDLTVNANVLIPRPETEHLVETVLALPLPEHCQVLELGTGSGAIAIALATERPHWSITAVDISGAALEVAQLNGKRHHIDNITWLQSDWYRDLIPRQFNLIVSNPPYIATDELHLVQQSLIFEPQQLALMAGTDGMRAFTTIIQQAAHWLPPGGYLCLEHGYRQAESVTQCMAANHFHSINTVKDLANHPRITYGCYNQLKVGTD
jgi:release factor glutamine methyltransferase